MSTKHCPRRWEVEAAHTGRLSGANLRAVREHLASHCQECGDEAHYLTSLERQLRKPAPPDDEVALRRLRRSTLERAQELIYRRAGGRSRRLRLAAISGGVCATLTALAFWFHAAPQRPSVVVVTAQVQPATWSQHRERDIEHVDLGEGVFSLVVRRGPSDPRVVVRIPEGEIEDLGTVFSVTVRGGKTARIAVSQGAVLLRRRGLPELRLLAGSRWEPAPNTRRGLALEAASAIAEAPGSQPSAANGSAPELPTALPSPVLRIGAKPAPKQPRVLPRTAAAHLSASATQLSPVQELPAEDEAYLQLIRLVRQQRGLEAERAASAYLQQFPNGFRRPDVERIRDAYPAPTP
jgi:hypothetical protein